MAALSGQPGRNVGNACRNKIGTRKPEKENQYWKPVYLEQIGTLNDQI